MKSGCMNEAVASTNNNQLIGCNVWDANLNFDWIWTSV